jgi:hypothetical protein
MSTPLDPAGDPDRYDPARDAAPSGPLDWALDPDRYDPAADALPPGRRAGRRSTLPELIGKDASFEDNPSPYAWALGLVATLAFLLLVAFVFSHLSP